MPFERVRFALRAFLLEDLPGRADGITRDGLERRGAGGPSPWGREP
jgi:hypothetical protein